MNSAVVDASIIKKYFPELTEKQQQQMDMLYDLYVDWNSKINVISRKDIDELYLRHVLHSLAIAKVCTFNDGAKVMDVGCGGGFPGIPLAIVFPQVQFTLVDSIGKKITVVNEVAAALGLTNVTTVHGRAESVNKKFDFVVSRAVTEMKPFLGWVWNRVEKGCKGSFPNGILYLKGGDLAEEIAATGKKCFTYSIAKHFSEEFFETKKIVYIEKK